MVGPNLIERIVCIARTLTQIEHILLHTLERRYGRNTHFVAKHLVFYFQHLIIIIGMRVPSVVGFVLIGHACGQVGLDVGRKFVYIPTMTRRCNEGASGVVLLNVGT